MPSRVFEDVLEVEAASVEPVAFGDDPGSVSAYPLSRLRLTGGTARLRLPVVVLENARVKATICPMLGGRIVALWMEGLGDIVAMPDCLTPEDEKGVRGVILYPGIRVSLDPERDSMALFDHMVHEPVSVDASAAVMVFGTCPGSHVSLQVVYSLAPDAVAVGVEARVFNRSTEQQPVRLCVEQCLRTLK